jgi:hypothetical protein
MRSIPMNPQGQAVQWQSPQQAQGAAAAIGAAAGTALGGTFWYLAAQVHPVGKYLGVAFPLVGGVLGYASWKQLVAPAPQPRLAR